MRTPNMTALARRGLRFTHVFPEGMPTVPVRNAILSGRRQFPYRGWYDRPGLISMPGWEPLARPDRSMLATLRRAGYWTAYVTDNPFVGFAGPYGRFRNSVNRFVRTGGQIGGRQQAGQRPRRHPPPLAPPGHGQRAHPPARGPLPRQQPPVGGPRPHLRGPRLPQRDPRAEPGRRAQPPVRPRRGHLRAARALDPAGALSRHVRRLGRPRAGSPHLRPREQLAALERAPRRDPPHARPLRGGGHAHRPLARACWSTGSTT